MEKIKQKISIHLWFNNEAEEAANYYTSIFKNAKIEQISRYQCGWLKDKYGVSWQVIPEMMSGLFKDHESENTIRAMNTMMEMKKLDIEKLQRAFDGKKEKSYS